jgi:hypothetical protein
MSGRLVGEVAAWLRTPAAKGLTVSERMVLMTIAERAHETTREMWGYKGDGVTQFDFLCEVVGIAPSGLTEVLKKIAAHRFDGDKGALEVRIQVGTTKAGAPLFAYRGTAMRFRLPMLPASVALPKSLGPDRPIPPAEPVDNPGDEPVDNPPEDSPNHSKDSAPTDPLSRKGRSQPRHTPGKGRSQPTPNTYRQAPYKDHPYRPGSPSHLAEEEDTGPPTATPPARTSHHMGWEPDYVEAREYLFALTNEGQEFMDAAAEQLGPTTPIAERVIHAAQAAHQAQEGIPA